MSLSFSDVITAAAGEEEEEAEVAGEAVVLMVILMVGLCMNWFCPISGSVLWVSCYKFGQKVVQFYTILLT